MHDGGGTVAQLCECIRMCACMLSDSSRVQLCVTPWTVACQAPLSMEFSKQEYWSGLSFPSPGDLPDPGMKLVPPAWQADSLLLCHLGSPCLFSILCQCQLPFPRHSAPPEGSWAMPTSEKYHLLLGRPHPHHVKWPELAHSGTDIHHSHLAHAPGQ